MPPPSLALLRATLMRCVSATSPAPHAPHAHALRSSRTRYNSGPCAAFQADALHAKGPTTAPEPPNRVLTYVRQPAGSPKQHGPQIWPPRQEVRRQHLQVAVAAAPA